MPKPESEAPVPPPVGADKSAPQRTRFWVGAGIAVALVALGVAVYAGPRSGAGAAEQRVDPALRELAELDPKGGSPSCQKGAQTCPCQVERLGRALDLDAHDLALRAFDPVAKACPGSQKLGGLKAEALARAGRFDEALLEATAALRLDSNDAYALYAKALNGFKRSTLAEAAELLAQAEKAGRGDESLRLEGRIAVSRGDFAKALKDFSALLKVRPDDGEAAFTLAIAYANLKKYNEARTAFLRLLKKNPKHVEARAHLAELTMQAGAFGETRHHLDELRRIAPEDPRIAAIEAVLKDPERARPGPSGVPKFTPPPSGAPSSPGAPQ